MKRGLLLWYKIGEYRISKTPILTVGILADSLFINNLVHLLLQG
jgi:hypothetical protein